MDASEVRRIDPETARQRQQEGKALLVCAYEADEKFRSNHLEGAKALSAFRDQLPRLSRDQEVIFYCA